MGERYDVERDIARAVAEGSGVPSDADIRATGGVPISPRAQVLLGHFSHAQTAVAAQRPGAEVDGLATTRRIIEYIARLEDVAIQPFSTVEGDTPREAIGLAAASLEQLTSDIETNGELTKIPLDPACQLGIDTWKLVAQRLRILEQRIGLIPGQSDAGIFAPSERAVLVLAESKHVLTVTASEAALLDLLELEPQLVENLRNATYAQPHEAAMGNRLRLALIRACGAQRTVRDAAIDRG